MAAFPEHVHRGKYVDYGRSWGSQTQYLCSTFTATLWTNILGILVAIAIARLFRLLQRGYLVMTGKGSASLKTSPDGWLWDLILDWITELRGLISLDDDSCEQVRKWRLPVILPLLLGAFAAITGCGVLSARLVTDSKALSAHPACGVYVYPPIQKISKTLNTSWATWPELQYLLAAESESDAYAQKCFYTEAGADGCNLFLQQSIPFNTSDVPCPFAEKEMCFTPRNISPVHFSTGAFDSRILGLNAPRTLRIRRNATCSPVTSNETFVKEEKEKDGYISFYHYFGSSVSGNYTTKTYALAKDLRRGHYLAKTTDNHLDWEPIPPLRAKNSSLISLIFIDSNGVTYSNRSFDPVFPAIYPVQAGNYVTYVHSYKSTWNQILGCVDTTEFQQLGHSEKWFPFDEMSSYIQSLTNIQEKGAAALLWDSLGQSTTGRSIMLRGSEGLITSKLIMGGLSMSLAEDQWRLEAQHLFEASLARIMISMKDTVMGTASHYTGMVPLAWLNWAICDTPLFLFRTQGWQNVNLTGSMWILIVSLFIILLAVPLKNERLLVEWFWDLSRHTVRYLKANSLRMMLNGWGSGIERGIVITLGTLSKVRREAR